MIYYNKLELLRYDNGYTKRQIAQMIGLNKDSYGQYENERSIIPLKHLNALCNIFNVSFDYIFSFSNNTNYLNSRTTINKNLIAKRLKELRKENKLTQEQLSKILIISSGRIASYELMKSEITTKVLYTICKKYNISADYLLGKTDSPKYLK